MAPTPIIGLPTVNDAMLTFSATCSCEAHPVLLVAARVGTMFGCAACRRAWCVKSYAVNPVTGHTDIELNIVVLAPEGAQP